MVKISAAVVAFFRLSLLFKTKLPKRQLKTGYGVLTKPTVLQNLFVMQTIDKILHLH